MIIRKASIYDLEDLYKIGVKTPELRTSATEAFMDKDEFKMRLTSKKNVFVLAEEAGKIVGFALASTEDSDSRLTYNEACLVFIAVLPNFRKKRIGQKLYEEIEEQLRKMGMTHIYSLANDEGKTGVIQFLKKNGLTEGHRYIWMDKKL